MKNSRFNVFVRENNGTELVYNTLRGSISRVNSELAQLLKSKDLAPLDNSSLASLVEDLKEQGILIPPRLDELEEYAQMHRRWKEGRENVEFNALLTYDCNFECPYCYQGRGEKGQLGETGW